MSLDEGSSAKTAKVIKFNEKSSVLNDVVVYRCPVGKRVSECSARLAGLDGEYDNGKEHLDYHNHVKEALV